MVKRAMVLCILILGSLSAYGYSFQADSSYISDDGNCIKAILNINILEDAKLMTVEEIGAYSGPYIYKLSQRNIAQIKALDNRKFGESKTVTISVIDGKEFIFKGGSCGRMQCDSLVIKEDDGEEQQYYQPIHGLVISKLKCSH